MQEVENSHHPMDIKVMYGKYMGANIPSAVKQECNSLNVQSAITLLSCTTTAPQLSR